MQSDTCADPRYMFNMVGIVHRHFNFPPFCLEGSRGGQFHYMLNVPTEGWHIRIICLFTTCSTLHLNFCYTALLYSKYVSSKTARAKSVSITWTDPLPNRVRISAGLLALWRPKVLSFPSHTTCDSCDERMYSCFAGIGLWLLRRFQLKRPSEREGRKQRCVLQTHNHSWYTTWDLGIIQNATGGKAFSGKVHQTTDGTQDGTKFLRRHGDVDHSRPQDVKHPFGMLDFI